jgi:uncharacterized protein (DUF1800 family)
MKRALALAVVLAAAAAAARAGAAPPACADPRPVVSTLRDRPVLLSGHRTTVSRLLRLRRDAGGATTRSRAEQTVYAVSVRLVKGRYDGAFDARVVVADPVTGQTMTVRLPSPDCHPGATPAQAARMDGARRTFDDACAPLEYLPWTKLQGTAEITGVLFFGPTGTELAPLLRFRFTGDTGC